MTHSNKSRAAARRPSASESRAKRSRPPTLAPAPAEHAVDTSTNSLTIVGVGASAGGLEAFIELLESLPRNPGLAIILVPHLSPSHDSALPVLLAPHTPMPVVQVTDGVVIQRDHVYVIPPNVQMELADGTLRLTPRPSMR